jgi:hypothetical protein
VVDDTLYIIRCVYWGGYTPLTFGPIAGILTHDGSVGGNVGLNELGVAEDITIFPNPVSISEKMLNISAAAGNYSLLVATIEGKIISSQSIYIPSERIFQFSCHTLNRGMYLIMLQRPGYCFYKKLVVN